MVVAKKWIYAKAFKGMPTTENLKIVEEELPPLKDGEYLVEAVFLSVDPYQRAYTHRLKIGETMIGSQTARIIESKDEKFPVGQYVIGNLGWRSHTICGGDVEVNEFDSQPSLLSFYDDSLPLSLYLGCLGMPGNTAYFGFIDICKPKTGETVVITGAAGAVGNHVGQIAKLLGCTVIGIAGSDKKNEWLKSIGFDHVINYKKQDIGRALKEVAPQGIDCYFDNVGGEISSTVMSQMNRFGRVSVCGAISSYNESNLPKVTTVQPYIVLKELEIKGFIVTTWTDRWLEGITQNTKWIKEGKLKYQETITEGFDKMLEAFIGMLNGDNIGKAVVKVEISRNKKNECKL